MKSCWGGGDQTSAWRDVNETRMRTPARQHTHTNTNPHFIKRAECPQGIQLSSINLNMLSLCTLKERKLIQNISGSAWNIMRLLQILLDFHFCVYYIIVVFLSPVNHIKRVLHWSVWSGTYICAESGCRERLTNDGLSWNY